MCNKIEILIFYLPFGESRLELILELIRLELFESLWASFNSLKYSSPELNGNGGVTRSGHWFINCVDKSIQESKIYPKNSTQLIV